MTIQDANREMEEQERALNAVHRMRAATRRELHLIDQLKATPEGFVTIPLHFCKGCRLQCIWD